MLCRAMRNEAKMTFKGVQRHLPRGAYFRERIPTQVKQNYQKYAFHLSWMSSTDEDVS